MGSEMYIRDSLRSVVRCAAEVDTALFRPPYGRISRQQSRAVRNRYELVMWDVLSADFDTGLSGDQCTLNVTRNAVPGPCLLYTSDAADALLCVDLAGRRIPKQKLSP